METAHVGPTVARKLRQPSHLLHPPLTESEAAEYLGVAVQTLRNWRHLRKGPPYLKLSPGPRGRIVYLIEDLVAHRQECRVVPEAN